MSLNGLTGSAGLKLGPLVLETLVKHYFGRLRAAQKLPATTSLDGVDHDGKQDGSVPNDNLRREELLYDQAFTIVKVSFVRVRSPRLQWQRSNRSVFPCSICLCFLEPSLIRMILSHHHRLVAPRTFCRLLPGKEGARSGKPDPIE
jgi:hypothetical protein